ncbi:UPF0178 protein Lmo1456 [Paenibacillus cisolokensis]|uniref:UPF0178 protein PACILC2_39210 n=1 Tax=Paenibacillus cisolokensis TaxID=1658519 RepID=A0ABQ4NAU8_9BACL|nr:YaiI/YqxD family protein [Paenibacillus cisolokensis]GIQ65353.1 UPF0178 protein Lmo1456 [Paenibacillus cisolokensis]
MKPGKPTIVVDADACPVKAEIARTGKQFGVPVLMVSSYDHLLVPEEGVDIVQVDRHSQAVDLYIVSRVVRGDIVVTQDFGLAAIVLAKGAVALSNQGQIYDDRTIGYLLDRRHEQAKRRRSGGRTKGPRAMTEEDRRHFQQKLTKVLLERQENSEP